MADQAVITAKTDYLGRIIGEAIEFDKLTEVQRKTSPARETMQLTGESLIGTYLLDLLKSGYRAEAALDMTYATLDRLPIALRRCLQTYCEEGMPLKQAADGTARSFAAYLFALGMNEHDARLKVIQKRTAFTAPDPDEGPLWAEMLRITAGTKREKDFLIPALEGMNSVYRMGKGLMILNVVPAIRAYKAAFGVDLAAFGLPDMALEADAEG